MITQALPPQPNAVAWESLGHVAHALPHASVPSSHAQAWLLRSQCVLAAVQPESLAQPAWQVSVARSQYAPVGHGQCDGRTIPESDPPCASGSECDLDDEQATSNRHRRTRIAAPDAGPRPKSQNGVMIGCVEWATALP